MAAPRILDPARACYEGYAAFTGGKTFDGREMPKWDDLDRRIQRAWLAAFRAGVLHTADEMKWILKDPE